MPYCDAPGELLLGQQHALSRWLSPLVELAQVGSLVIPNPNPNPDPNPNLNPISNPTPGHNPNLTK